MNEYSYFLTRFASLMGIGIFYVKGDLIQSFTENVDSNPIFQEKNLRIKLQQGAKEQDEPYIYCDKYMTYFSCIKKDDSYYVIGPMSLKILNKIELRQFYEYYGIILEKPKQMRHFNMFEMLDVVKTIANIILGVELEDDKLIYRNKIVQETKEQESQEHILFSIKKDEEEAYHHTYQEERKLLDSIKDGDVESALKYNHNMDANIGKLSMKESNHWKNLAVVAITLCTRAAIEAGVSPYIAYQISDFYIQKSDNSQDVVQIITYRDHAVEELTKQVIKKQGRKTTSYVERSKDYVEKNYKKKICLEDVAEKMGISKTYLSRLFKHETGDHFQNYVVGVRLEHAANLLKYSDETLSHIAEYVNFPSQSYMGKAFKEKYNMTPKQYREINRPSEFYAEANK